MFVCVSNLQIVFYVLHLYITPGKCFTLRREMSGVCQSPCGKMSDTHRADRAAGLVRSRRCQSVCSSVHPTGRLLTTEASPSSVFANVCEKSPSNRPPLAPNANFILRPLFVIDLTFYWVQLSVIYTLPDETSHIGNDIKRNWLTCKRKFYNRKNAI